MGNANIHNTGNSDARIQPHQNHYQSLEYTQFALPLPSTINKDHLASVCVPVESRRDRTGSPSYNTEDWGLCWCCLVNGNTSNGSRIVGEAPGWMTVDDVIGVCAFSIFPRKNYCYRRFGGKVLGAASWRKSCLMGDSN